MSASRICNSLKTRKCFRRAAPLYPRDPCDTSGADTSVIMVTCRSACGVPIAVAHYSGGCNPCRFPRGLVPLVVGGVLRKGGLPMCNSNDGMHS